MLFQITTLPVIYRVADLNVYLVLRELFVIIYKRVEQTIANL